MEEILIIEVADTVTKGLAPLAIAGIASAIPGIAKGIGSLFGGRKRKQREKDARTLQEQRMSQFEATEFTNPYADIRNEFENLRVATEAAEFQSQQQQQGLAQTLAGLRGAGGGTGAAAIAQALSQAQARGQQQIAADIAKQEAMNEKLAAQGAMKAQQLEAAGEAQRQQLEMGKQATLLGMANQELASATRARAQAKADLVGGIGALGSAAFSAFGSKIGAGNQAAALGAQSPKTLALAQQAFQPTVTQANQLLTSNYALPGSSLPTLGVLTPRGN